MPNFFNQNSVNSMPNDDSGSNGFATSNVTQNSDMVRPHPGVEQTNATVINWQTLAQSSMNKIAFLNAQIFGKGPFCAILGKEDNQILILTKPFEEELTEQETVKKIFKYCAITLQGPIAINFYNEIIAKEFEMVIENAAVDQHNKILNEESLVMEHDGFFVAEDGQPSVKCGNFFVKQNSDNGITFKKNPYEEEILQSKTKSLTWAKEYADAHPSPKELSTKLNVFDV